MVLRGVFSILRRLPEGRSGQVPEFQMVQFSPGIQNGERINLFGSLGV
jgi:hypothetical protein